MTVVTPLFLDGSRFSLQIYASRTLITLFLSLDYFTYYFLRVIIVWAPMYKDPNTNGNRIVKGFMKRRRFIFRFCHLSIEHFSGTGRLIVYQFGREIGAKWSQIFSQIPFQSKPFKCSNLISNFSFLDQMVLFDSSMLISISISYMYMNEDNRCNLLIYFNRS